MFSCAFELVKTTRWALPTFWFIIRSRLWNQSKSKSEIYLMFNQSRHCNFTTLTSPPPPSYAPQVLVVYLTGGGGVCVYISDCTPPPTRRRSSWCILLGGGVCVYISDCSPPPTRPPPLLHAPPPPTRPPSYTPPTTTTLRYYFEHFEHFDASLWWFWRQVMIDLVAVGAGTRCNSRFRTPWMNTYDCSQPG